MTVRWETYVADLEEPGPRALKNVTAAEESLPGSVLYLLSVGFDPRCLTGLEAFLAMDCVTSPRLVRIGLPPPSGGSNSATERIAHDNQTRFEELVSGLKVDRIDYPEVHSRTNSGPSLARKIVAPKMLGGVSTVVVDISSMPSSIYFSLIAALLRVTDKLESDSERFDGNVLLVTCENPGLDAAITDLGVHRADYVGGFRPRGRLDPESDGPIVWAPVIGEGCEAALNAVHTLLEPDEICPILPFPARHPRRSDALLLEHRTMLFDSFRVAESNIVFAHESNPFDLYRALSRLNQRYEQALKKLGQVTLAISAHSSKLLSLGALLAAYENGLPLADAVASDYELSKEADLAALTTANRLSCIWLAGEPYR